MLKKTTVVAALIAALSLTATVAFAHDRFFSLREGRTVNDYDRTPGGDDVFSGKLVYGKDRCEPDRKVNLLRKQPGKDLQVGRDRTNDRGRFVIRKNGGLPQGRYYIRVPKRDIGPPGHDHICGAAEQNDPWRVPADGAKPAAGALSG